MKKFAISPQINRKTIRIKAVSWNEAVKKLYIMRKSGQMPENSMISGEFVWSEKYSGYTAMNVLDFTDKS
jgi:hypothetical protein